MAFGASAAGAAVEGDLVGLLLLEIEFELRKTLLVLVNVECFLVEVNELVQIPVVFAGVGGGAVAVVSHLNN